MRKSLGLLGFAVVMAALLSCNRNTKSEPAVYELEVYKTQEIVLDMEDRDMESEITLPGGLVDIDGKDALVFYSKGGIISYYDLETGKKMSGVSNVEPEVCEALDTVIAVDAKQVEGDSKMLGVRLEYDKTNDLYWAEKYFDTDYYGDHVHELILVSKDFNYIGTIYNSEHFPWFDNGRIVIDIEPIKNNSVVKVNYLKLTKTDRDYNEYIDSCRADLEKRHQEREEYKIKFDAEKSPVVKLVKSQNEIDSRIYKVLTLYCKDEISGGDKMVIDSLIANKEIVNLASIYLVISAGNEELAASYVKKNGLDCIEKIVFDTEGVANTDAGQGNPRFMYVEDGLITIDTVYSTEEVSTEMIQRLFGEGKHTRYYIYDGELIVVATGGAFIDD
ncbi:MAG: hypothetical protein IK025_12455 [Bacteroidales bacterium]|nr:hypothetical protein [Bacteroidales bacterium]